VSVSNRELLRQRLKKGAREPRLKYYAGRQHRKLLKSNDERNSASKHQERRDEVQGKGGSKKSKRKRQPKSKPGKAVSRVEVGLPIFAILSGIVLRRIYRTNPTLLKPALLGAQSRETYAWGLILRVLLTCLAFASGIATLFGIIIFIWAGILLVNKWALIIIVLVTAYFFLREFDRSTRKYTASAG
jgi:hypothetical protein